MIYSPVSLIHSLVSLLLMVSTYFFFFPEYQAELNEWGPVFTLWSNSEDKLSLALRAMAKAVEKNFLSLQDLVSKYCLTIAS